MIKLSKNLWLLMGTILIVVVFGVIAGVNSFPGRELLFNSKSSSNNIGKSDQTPSESQRVKSKSQIRSESNSDRLKRLRKEADVEMHKQREIEEKNGTNVPVAYHLLGQNNKLTTSAAEAAKLTEDEALQVNGILADMLKKSTQNFAQRAKLDVGESSKDSTIYYIPAVPDRGNAASEELRARIEGAVGNDKQKILLRGLDPFAMFGGFGAYDIRLQFETVEGVPSYKYEYIDTNTGRPSAFGGRTMESFKAQFGDSFSTDGSINK